MTDEVPVSDVLLEATEYLCKLGTNLKLRSENLKEKRIAKSKLKNTHAVQKAADKLLLLCELSKKSLENVEVGVKKILRVCVKDQGPIPVKPANFKRDVECHYIKDGSQKLRMSHKICLDHYKSVQVRARRLPLSMQEKYPVFFDCQLYRSRRRKESEDRLEEIPENMEVDRDVMDSLGNVKENETSEKKEKSSKDSGSPKKVKDERDHSSSSKAEKHSQKESKSDKSDKIEKHRSKSDSKSKHHDSCERKDSKEDKRYRKEYKETKIAKSEENGDLSHDKKDKEKSSSKKKYGRLAVDDSSDDQCLDKEIESSKKVYEGDKSPERTKDRNEPKKRVVIVDDSDDEKSLKEKEKSSSKAIDEDQFVISANRSESKRQKHDENISNSSIDQTFKVKMVSSPTRTEYDSNDGLKTKNDQSFDEVQTYKKRKLSQSESSEKDKDNQGGGRSDDDNIQTDKPLLKLVDLSKLLKPDALTKESKKNATTTLPSHRNKDSELKRKEKEHHERKIKEEKYWEQKRKEVLAFKPKKFHIHIHKLPEFTEDFLRSNKIKKITHKGDIVAQRHKTVRFETPATSLSDKEHTSSKDVSSESESEKQKIKNKTSRNSSKKPTPDMNEVKSALLDDSDSDKDQSTVTSEAEKVKKTLLNDSDSDGSSKEISQPPISAEYSKEIETKNNTVKTTHNNIDLLSKDKVENVKNTLLKDSDSDESIKQTCHTSPLVETSKEVECNDKNDEMEINDELSREKNSSTIKSDSDRSIKESSKEIEENQAKSPENYSDELTGKTETELLKEADRKEDSKETEKNQESSCETSKNKDTTPVGSDAEKPPEKSPITSSSKKKRKNMMESIHAKKMLLTYSSSSDTDDDKLKDAIKEIKTSLLEGSDEEIIEKVRENHRRKLLASSSSDDDDDDAIPKIQKDKKSDNTPDKTIETALKDVDKKSTHVEDEESDSIGKVRSKKRKLN